MPKVVPHFNHGPPWNTKYLSKWKKKKNKLYKKFKTDRATINYSNYCLARTKYTIANQRAYNIYLNKVKNKFKSDSKSFYRFVNSKRRAADSPSVMKLDSHESSDNKVINNLFL